jgi:alpha-1,2-rhamnosyltransferase
MASDIPVFHEIGGEFIAYFDLNKPNSLAELVRKFEDHGKLPAVKELSEWQWPGWRDSTRHLIQEIVINSRSQADLKK